MTFETWWRDEGQRVQAFTAMEWARAGWRGCKLHETQGLADSLTIDPEVILLGGPDAP